MKPHAHLPFAVRLAAAFSLLMLAGWGLGAAPAQAQQQYTAALHTATRPVISGLEVAAGAPAGTLEANLTELLDYRIGNIRIQALQQIIFLSTAHHESYDFTGAVPKILAFYENEQEDEAFRIMALSALFSIGDAGAMDRIGQRVANEPSKRLRYLTMAALKLYHKSQPI